MMHIDGYDPILAFGCFSTLHLLLIPADRILPVTTMTTQLCETPLISVSPLCIASAEHWIVLSPVSFGCYAA